MSLLPDNLIGEMKKKDDLKSKAEFNKKTKFGMIRSATMKVPDLASFEI